MNTPRLNLHPFAPFYLCHAGVKGARRTTWRAFDTATDAHAYATRVRSGNSIGSYWCHVYPSPLVREGILHYRARTGVNVAHGMWPDLLDACVNHLDSAEPVAS